MSGQLIHTAAGEPAWLGDEGAFALTHLAARPGDTGMVLCAPFGWEDMSSYPARRALAQRLSDRGVPCVRFDWPGTGDAAGDPGDPDRLGAWCAALSDAADWLRASAPVERVAVLGLGLAGVVAAAAIERGAAIDDLVLWGAPRDGRSFVRGERAFSRLQSDKLSGSEDTVLPDGWLESGGYVLSAETLTALGRVDLRTVRTGTLQRALLLDRDGLQLDAGVAEHLRAGGVEVVHGGGEGYAQMVSGPHLTTLPEAVARRIEGWLEDAPPGRPHAAGALPGTVTATSLSVDGSRERAVTLPLCGGESAFGVVNEPEDPHAGAPTVVLLSVWAERRCGPNRMWTEAARRLAARGVPTARVDLLGVGDADGDSGWLRYLVNVHDPGVVAQVRVVLDRLAEAGLGERFVLVGLCSGGFWALQALAQDERVVGALVMNTDAPWHDPAQQARRDASKLRYALQPEWWARVIRGEVRAASLRAFARRVLRDLRRRLLRTDRDALSSPLRSLELTIEALVVRGAHLTLGYTEGELMRERLQREGLAERAASWPGIRIADIRSRDHNLRPLPAQQDVHQLIDDLVDELLDRAAATPHRPSA